MQEMPPVEQDRSRDVGEAVLNMFAVLVIVLMLAIVAQVVLSVLDVNPVATFQSALPLLGRAITLNSLLDFQWHLLVIVGLLPAALVWRRDGHVRVDFLYQQMGARGRARVDLAGHLALTGPFLVMCIPASWSFMVRAYASAEMSASGGLTDRFLIKTVLPLGFVLIALVLVAELPRLARRAFGPPA